MADGTASTARSRLMAVLPRDHRAQIAAVSAQEKALKIEGRAHEGVRPSRERTMAVDWGSGNRIVSMDGKQLRDSARALVRDYDVAKNAIEILVQNTVGSGVDVRPAPRRSAGPVNQVIAAALRDLWDEWWDRPEVTWQHDYGKCQQLMAASAFRDGEAFRQQLLGPVNFLDHGTRVPFSIEMLEADLVPLDLNDPKRSVSQGIERNGWGRVTGYYVYLQHPGESFGYNTATKRVPAEQMMHLANIDRIHQVRGLSVFAPVMNRFRDIQDYEASERIAAKVAASFCAQIVKSADEGGMDMEAAGAAVDRAYRSLSMVPGMIGDDLRPGEKIEIIDSNRPNPNAAAYVDGNLRRAAGGLRVSFSSLGMNYNGTYSAQRQELVERFGAYVMLSEWFIARMVRPDWNKFVEAAVLANLVKVPAGWTLRDMQRATFIRPQMPWIDPLKEVMAMGERVDRGWMADPQAITLGGNDPEEVRRMQEEWVANGGSAVSPAARAKNREAALALATKDEQ